MEARENKDSDKKQKQGKSVCLKGGVKFETSMIIVSLPVLKGVIYQIKSIQSKK